MNIKTLKLKDLNPAPYNPRTITNEQLEGLENSIKTFDCLELPIVNIRDNKNIIVSGHQRYKALLNLGKKETECVLVDLDEIKEKALNIAMNNKHTSGDWDISALEPLLEELQNDFAEFEDINLDQLMYDFEESTDLDIEEQKNINESCNFSIKCEDISELEELKLKLNTGSNSMKASELVKCLG